MTEKVVIVGCGKEKKEEGYHQARDLYTGFYTQLRIKYGEKIGNYYILSAKHGLIPPSRVIEPYDKKMSEVDDPAWNLGIEETINESASNYWDENTEVILLAGKEYVEAIEPVLPDYVSVKKPFEDTKGIGEQIAWLKERVDTPQKSLEEVS